MKDLNEAFSGLTPFLPAAETVVFKAALANLQERQLIKPSTQTNILDLSYAITNNGREFMKNKSANKPWNLYPERYNPPVRLQNDIGLRRQPTESNSRRNQATTQPYRLEVETISIKPSANRSNDTGSLIVSIVKSMSDLSKEQMERMIAFGFWEDDPSEDNMKRAADHLGITNVFSVFRLVLDVLDDKTYDDAIADYEVARRVSKNLQKRASR